MLYQKYLSQCPCLTLYFPEILGTLLYAPGSSKTLNRHPIHYYHHMVPCVRHPSSVPGCGVEPSCVSRPLYSLLITWKLAVPGGPCIHPELCPEPLCSPWHMHLFHNVFYLLTTLMKQVLPDLLFCSEVRLFTSPLCN